ncbi:MAG: DUF1513 domain-containing protein [Alphaproteobacteria bacterium]|nr:DUF1513 domain-containing protein [Alphaproteobacteria bacterium]
MQLSRRHALALLSALAVPISVRDAIAGQNNLFLTSMRDATGAFAAALINESGDVLYRVPLQARAHDGAMSPDGRSAVLFARRPGHFILAFDLNRRTVTHQISARDDRHFYGHGFYSVDGKLLFAAENDFDKARSVLGIYDATQDYVRVGEYDGGGVGCHQAILLSDGQTIAIANGGIATHPDYPREKLNLAQMDPCLTYLRASDGEVLQTVRLPKEYEKLSLRHLTEVTPGTVWVAGQYEGSLADCQGLLGVHRGGKEMLPVEMQESLVHGMNYYTGAIIASGDKRRVIATSPRGGVVGIWDAESLALQDTFARPDVCGAAPDGDGFVVTDGVGDISNDRQILSSIDGIAYDNHLVPVPAILRQNSIGSI